jgi:polar amino acid transport system permease protein
MLTPLQTADWAFVFDNVGYLAGGVLWTVVLTLTSVVLGFLLGFPAGALELYGSGWLRRLVGDVGTVFRGTPIVVIMVFFFFVIRVSDSAFVTATLALGLRSAAYQSQIFRGALQSVDEGQLEAARAIGLPRYGAVRHVVVPQALRRSVPSFQNEFTIVLKDTSVAFAIGVGELLKRSRDLFISAEHGGTAVFEIVVFMSAIYFVLTFATNRGLDWVNAQYHVPTGEGS